ncbi:MAG: glycosyltransferase, partial [Thermoanaerobaculia bacterium]
GHSVTVYCREAGPPAWNGIRRIELPSVGHKYLETVSHSLFSAVDALRRDFDAVLVCNAANAFVLPLLRAARIPVAINVDGIERRRRKWNFLGRVVYAAGEALSVSFASRIVADADVIASYYRENYGADCETIRYGAEFPDEPDSDILARLGVESGRYVLYVSRIEPENNPLEVVEAYRRLLDRRGEERTPPLVMVGQGLYAPDLVRRLREHEGSRILLPGAIYGRDYRTLQRRALVYIQATEVGGTHPALIEAMASGGAVLAHGTPENREVGGDSVGYFQLRPAETLSESLETWLDDAVLREDFRARARRLAADRYSWETVTDAYERLFSTLV